MICYRDRTYCAATECLHFKDCPSALTDEVELSAQRIGLPISRFLDPKKNYCYKPHGICERERDSTLPAA